ncbi:hypothetical protein IAR50_003120 [Cryptococcus sp. DSM 104548]
MAALPRMLYVAREEAATVTAELVHTARTAAVEGLPAERASMMEAMNPVAVRQSAEATVKESTEGNSSLLSQHLSQTSSFATNPIKSNILNSFSHDTMPTTSARSLIGQVLEQDVGFTLKEAFSNAAQTGVEEQVDKMGDTVKLLAQGDKIGVKVGAV